MSDFFVCLRTVRLELGADIFPHIHIGDINGKNFKRGPGIKAFFQNSFGDRVRIFQDLFMGTCRTNGGDDPFTHPRQDGFFTGAAYQPVDIGPNRNTGKGFQLDAVLGHGCNQRCLDDLGVDTHLNGLQHIPSGQIDCSSPIEYEIDVGFICRNQRLNDSRYIPPCQIMGFQVVS